MTNKYLVNNISLSLDASLEEAFSVAGKKLKSLGLNTAEAEFSIYRKSVDARKKNDIKIVYSVLSKNIYGKFSEKKGKESGITEYSYTEPTCEIGTETLNSPIVVVGCGPAGLFAALILAERGYKTILLERGGSVEERNRAIEKFKNDRILDVNTNIQFGAGGAGTFSDGKLVTRINDSMSSYILRRLVEFGAPSEIMYSARPHIGTDILSTVVNRIIDQICKLGGEVRFHSLVTDYIETAGRITAVKTERETIPCSALVMAIGHSSRDTYNMLLNKGVDIVAKPFSVGMRIEHPASVIDTGMYGEYAGHPALGHAEYNLSYNTSKRGVYTFCMCPGGEVVAAASEVGGVVVNGMSRHSRSGRNSNSAVCCSIFKEDYGSNPKAAIEFQRKIEKNAFITGGSNYSAPMTTFGDLLDNRFKTEPTIVKPTYMDGGGVKIADPNKYLPTIVVDHIKQGIIDFDKKIHGFAMREAVLTGAETRTSAPVRIVRDNETRLATGFTNLYPCGEGAGYAGGITSAAIDGVRTAFSIITRFKP